jgi:hypothetical protein
LKRWLGPHEKVTISDHETLLFESDSWLAEFVLGGKPQIPFINSTGVTVNSIAYDRRVYWMREATQALFNSSSPWYHPHFTLCSRNSSFAAFGSVIVDHTSEADELVCKGANDIFQSGGFCPSLSD